MFIIEILLIINIVISLIILGKLKKEKIIEIEKNIENTDTESDIISFQDYLKNNQKF